MSSLNLSASKGPQRIICLTEEPTELLYALGESERIVGISAYTLRPPQAKQDKAIVSAFIDGSVHKIKALKPDLVIGFSDIQAKLASELIAANLQVIIFNQRSIQEILNTILDISRLVAAPQRGLALVAQYQHNLERIAEQAAQRSYRPRVYFEEWDEPTICGIHWVSELLEIAGADDVFKARARGKSAKERFISEQELLTADPELIFACWCGKPFDREAFLKRPPIAQLRAAQDNQIYEVPPEIILQPGPAALTDGINFLEKKIRALSRR